MAFKLVAITLALMAAINSGYCCTEQELAKCKLPYCLCPSVEIPNGLKREEIPQMVFLTFDDAVSVQNWFLYEDLILPLKNPNGSPISATFYITHEYTNYSMVHDLYTMGHEIALHTITHKPDVGYWKALNKTGWQLEVSDQRGQVAHFGKISKSAVVGIRSPFLQTGGDPMMETLYDEGLEYDCSRPTLRYTDPPLWPYTLDYDLDFHDCQIEPCSTKPYPGFWIVPMVDNFGGNGEACAMQDTCNPVPETKEDTFELLKRNFERHYTSTKAPYGVFIHASWFFPIDDPRAQLRKEGYRQFLAYLQEKQDVYMVSVAKGLEWMRKPTALDAIESFAPWIHENDLPRSCLSTSCHIKEGTPDGLDRYMPSCVTCPKRYPWLGNPYGLENN